MNAGWGFNIFYLCGGSFSFPNFINKIIKFTIQLLKLVVKKNKVVKKEFTELVVLSCFQAGFRINQHFSIFFFGEVNAGRESAVQGTKSKSF